MYNLFICDKLIITADGVIKLLDRSVPEKSIIMKLSADKAIKLAPPVLPKGFAFRPYHRGDAAVFADIETSVGEFSDKSFAESFFAAEYIRYSENRLKENCIFIEGPKNEAALSLIWEAEGKVSLQWLAVRPEFQGLGLGRAALRYAVCLSQRLYPKRDLLVHTRTWSHNALCLYYNEGFRLTDERCPRKIGGFHINENAEALEILKNALPPEVYNGLNNQII